MRLNSLFYPNYKLINLILNISNQVGGQIQDIILLFI